MVDVKVLEVYVGYIYCFFKMWLRLFFEVYDL